MIGEPFLKKYCRNGTCGVCLMCMQNARWDRIWLDKFADPSYYKLRAGPQSSLGGHSYPVGDGTSDRRRGWSSKFIEQ